MKTAIYALCEPETGTVRYVGKADNPEARLDAHLAPSNLRTDSPKNQWIQRLQAQGLSPRLRILAWVDGSEWRVAERRWIRHFQSRGARLTNSRDGGGGPGPRSLTVTAKSRAAAEARRLLRLPLPSSIQWDLEQQRWRAGIVIHGEEQLLGFYHDSDEALLALDAARARLGQRGLFTR